MTEKSVCTERMVVRLCAYVPYNLSVIFQRDVTVRGLVAQDSFPWQRDDNRTRNHAHTIIIRSDKRTMCKKQLGFLREHSFVPLDTEDGCSDGFILTVRMF